MPPVKRQREKRISRLRSAVGDKWVIGLSLEIRIIQIDVGDTMSLRRKHHQASAIHQQWLNSIDKCKMTDMVDAELSFKTIGRTTKWRCPCCAYLLAVPKRTQRPSKCPRFH